MPKIRVNVRTGLPTDGYVVVEARDEKQGAALVEQMIAELELTSGDDRILFEQADDPRVLSARLADKQEQDEEAIAACFDSIPKK